MSQLTDNTLLYCIITKLTIIALNVVLGCYTCNTCVTIIRSFVVYTLCTELYMYIHICMVSVNFFHGSLTHLAVLMIIITGFFNIIRGDWFFCKSPVRLPDIHAKTIK